MAYEGWKNKETWLVIAHQFFDQEFEYEEFDTVDELAEAMLNYLTYEWGEEESPRGGLAQDLFGNALENIDFLAVAKYYAKKPHYFVKPKPRRGGR